MILTGSAKYKMDDADAFNVDDVKAFAAKFKAGELEVGLCVCVCSVCIRV